MLAIFLDVETSGLDPFSHRVLEIAFKILDAQTGEERCVYQSVVRQSIEVWENRSPMSIEVNGFSWEKLETGKEEKQVGQDIIQLFRDFKIERGRAVYICQNPAFDRSFFAQLVDVYTQEEHHWPYHWLDFASMYWVLQIKKIHKNHQALPIEMNLSKNAIAQQYHLPAEPIPHSAINGVNHLILCYQKVVGFSS
jgi:DNA polymerase-3 subunit epsilon/oligoribonuclease